MKKFGLSILVKLFFIILLCFFYMLSQGEAKVKLGIDNINEYKQLFAGKKVGLITNATGYDSEMVSTVERMLQFTDLRVLFAPEHGIQSELANGEWVDNYIDKASGLRVYSLYGNHKKPTTDMLSGLDILAFDIQDIGVRYYTYISTLYLAMQAAAENNIEVVVFDRPNPLGGIKCEGIVQIDGFESYIGIKAFPVRYGLTIGELASYFNDRYNMACKLSIVPLSNWRRSMLWTDTGLAWLPTSPNMPTWQTALVYPGTCLLEGTNISEGRGTTTPFRFFGAPNLDNYKLVKELNLANLPGVEFRPIWFTPKYSKYAGDLCAGIDVVITSEYDYLAWKTGIVILKALINNYPELTIDISDNMDDKTLFECELGMPGSIIYTWTTNDLLQTGELDTQAWLREYKKYWLYHEI